jgi:hypothetical protein
MRKLFCALRAVLCVYLALSLAACPHLCFDSHLRVGGVLRRLRRRHHAGVSILTSAWEVSRMTLDEFGRLFVSILTSAWEVSRAAPHRSA